MAGGKEDSVRLGQLEIVLPSAGESRCYVFHDLAGLLGLEYNSDAVERLKAEWKRQGKRGRLEIDAEADAVSVSAGKDAILDVVVLLHELAPAGVARPTVAEIDRARAAIKRYKRPPRVRWEVGDVFAAPLLDGSFALGQVLWEMTFDRPTSVRGPTVVLYDHRVERLEEVDLDAAHASRPIAILHVLSTLLDAGTRRVLGRRPITLDPFSGPCGKPSDAGSIFTDRLESLANAWHGLSPWNEAYRSDHFDGFLLRGVTRPPSAWLLTDEERGARGLPIGPPSRTASLRDMTPANAMELIAALKARLPSGST